MTSIIPLEESSEEYLRIFERDRTGTSLFLFVDSAEQHRLPTTEGIRGYNQFSAHANHPKSAGIILGETHMFPFFTIHNDLSFCHDDNTCYPDVCRKHIIDETLHEIRELIATHNYQRVYFQAEDSHPRPLLIVSGSGEPLQQYATDEIYKMGTYSAMGLFE